MERRKFEDTFKDAFQGAEAEPSENVWTNLELDLEKEESGRMKRRLLFYQMVAAASIAFAMLMTGVGYYALSNRETSNAPTQIASADTHIQQSRGTNTRDGDETASAIMQQTEDGREGEGNNTEDASLGNQYSSHQPMRAEQLNTDYVQDGDRREMRNAASPLRGGEVSGNNQVSSSETLLSSRTNSSSRISSSTELHTNGNGNTLQGAGVSSAPTVTNRYNDASTSTGSHTSSRPRTTENGNALNSARVSGAPTVASSTLRKPSTKEAATIENGGVMNGAGASGSQAIANRYNAPASAIRGSQGSSAMDLNATEKGNALKGANVSGAPMIANLNNAPASTVAGSAVGSNTASLRKNGALDNQTATDGQHNLALVNSGNGMMVASDMSTKSNGDKNANQGTTPGGWMSGAMITSPQISNGTSANQIAAHNSSGQTAIVNKTWAEQSIAYTGQPLPPLAPTHEVKLAIVQEAPQQDPVALMFARLEQRERELRDGGDKKKKNKKDKEEDAADESEKLWTSAGFAAGGFTNFTNASSDGTAMGSSALVASKSSLASQQVNASGASYSVGVGMGAKVSKRWIVQGGLNYQTQMYDYTSNKAVPMGTDNYDGLQALSVTTLDKANNSNGFDARTAVPTAEYTIKNDSRFVSFPVQAGYLLVNKRTGVQLNGGVSTDLFLQNTNGSSDSGGLQSTKERLGDNSTYRSVNFSGLLGTEVSYKLGQHYRLALNPGVRYAFNSVFKSSTGVQAMPLTFDVGLRFRYIFH